MPAGQNLIDRMQQTIAEIRQASVDQPDGRRQDALEEVFRAARRESGIAGDRGVAAGKHDIGGDVLEENGIERRGLIEGQRRHQPRLGSAGR